MSVSLPNSQRKQLSNSLNEQLPSEKVVDTGQLSNHKVQKTEPRYFLNKCYDVFSRVINLLQPANIIRAVVNPKNVVRFLAVSNLFGFAQAKPTNPNSAPGIELAQGGLINQGVGQEVPLSNIEDLQQYNPADNMQRKLLAIAKDQENIRSTINSKLDYIETIVDSIVLKNLKKQNNIFISKKDKGSTKNISVKDLYQIVADFNKEEIEKGSRPDSANLSFISGVFYLSIIDYSGDRSRSLVYELEPILGNLLSNLGAFREDNVESTGKIDGFSLEKIAVLDQAIRENHPATKSIDDLAKEAYQFFPLPKKQVQASRLKLDETYENVIASKKVLQEKQEALHQKLKDNHDILITGYYTDGQPKVNRKLADKIYKRYFPDKADMDKIINDYSQNAISKKVSDIMLSHPHLTNKNNNDATIWLKKNGNEVEVTSVILRQKNSEEEFDIIQTIRDNKINHPTEIILLVNELARDAYLFIHGDGVDDIYTKTNNKKNGILKEYTQLIKKIFPEKSIIFRNNNQKKAKKIIKQEL